MNGGRIGLSILNTAVAKIQPDVLTLFFKGILCNVLVCLAVWLAYAGRSVTDKIVALILPISAFIAAGFEHCVANMYFLPLAWLMTSTGKVPDGFDVSAITLSGIVHNLVPVTLGNIVGGAGPGRRRVLDDLSRRVRREAIDRWNFSEQSESDGGALVDQRSLSALLARHFYNLDLDCGVIGREILDVLVGQGRQNHRHRVVLSQTGFVRLHLSDEVGLDLAGDVRRVGRFGQAVEAVTGLTHHCVGAAGLDVAGKARAAARQHKTRRREQFDDQHRRP